MASVVHKTYVLGNYRLEPDKRSLDLAGEPVRLANKPFQVLLYLIDNRHRFVSRNELLERFWEGKDVYDVALSKCIGAIRKSLDDRAEAPRFIETRWAEGYRYIGPIEEQLASSDTSLSEVETLRGIKIVVE